jgi:Lon protease-like protein
VDQLLALFPLHTVLFPGTALPLHIFEERYKTMIGRCINLKQPFGVVLIREGQAEGEPAEPYDIGTTAYVTNILPTDNGRLYIVAEGRQRFRIKQVIQTRPYLIADVEYLEDKVSVEQQVQADRLQKLYERYRDAMTRATGVPQQLSDLPDDPLEISFHLSALLQVPYLSKQQLLEADLDTRLESLMAALDDEMRYLPPPSNIPPPPGNRWTLN